ncbi:hypothetical protein V7128_05855 [Neobacillus vireti]|uniref:hypothetical protein n=1 Tax=Neobacillus vireti TaxID=220686 RepID=UPI002FFFE002
MENYQNRVCSVCGDHVVLGGESNSVPMFQDDSAICAECSGKGYRFCEECKKPFNANQVDYKNFKYVYSLFKWKEIDPVGKFCSNECYNMELLDEEISYHNLTLLEVQQLKIHDEKSEEEKEYMVNNAINRIKELEGFKKDLVALRN